MNKEEMHVLLELSLKEAALLKLLRAVPFGKLIVHTKNGEPLRVVIEESKELQDSDGLMLANKGIKVYAPEEK